MKNGTCKCCISLRSMVHTHTGGDNCKRTSTNMAAQNQAKKSRCSNKAVILTLRQVI